MALIRCPECWENVSDKAEKCPNCGVQIKKRKKAKGRFISEFVSICTLFTTIISICIAEQSLDISKEALKISRISLNNPVFDIDVDWENDKLSFENKTYDLYKIRRVLYGKVRTIAIMTDDYSQISSVELHEEDNEINFEKRFNVEMSCSEEELEEYSKKFELSLGGGRLKAQIG